MPAPKLSPLELKVMHALWTHGASSVREVQETLRADDRPAYTTVQTVLYRLEAKKAVRRTRKIGNAHIFEAVTTKEAAQRRLVDELLALFGGRAQPLIAHLVDSGRLTLEDVEEAQETLRRLQRDDQEE